MSAGICFQVCGGAMEKALKPNTMRDYSTLKTVAILVNLRFKSFLGLGGGF